MNQLPVMGEFKVLRLKQDAQAQITDYLRDEICSGNLKPGTKLPSTQELAQRWETHTATVHKAMEPLVKEGLLIRMIRKGTFVREREEKLTCVGVYSRTTRDAPFAHAVREMVKEELHKDGIELDVWTDTRPLDQQGKPWEPFVKAAAQRRFQAFIGVEVDRSLLGWQQSLPVPSAFLAGLPSMPNNVDADSKQMMEISLGELARQGCRSVGLIAPIMNADKFTHPDGSHNAWFDLVEHFTTVTADLGLTVKNEWMRLFSYHGLQPKEQERFGYEEFFKLWSQPEKPEGLLVFSDVTARGAITAIREKHVRVPEDLKLVLHKNENIDLFCPMPATFVVSSERDAARALIEQIKKQFHGETCERVSLPSKLIAHINP
jgi:DNA-binding LacI/PurR family transcriptional regulator